MTEHDCEIHHHEDRLWLELPAAAAELLHAKAGDTVVVVATLANDEQREIVGLYRGTQKAPARKRKHVDDVIAIVWLVGDIDVDAIVSVTLKRKRAA